MKKWTALLLCVLMAWPLAASGQELNQPIPACSNAEIIEVALVVSSSEVLDNVSSIADRVVEAPPSDMVAIAADLDEYQVMWWTEVVPALPNCSFAAELETTVGRYIDEMLFATTMTHIANSIKEQGGDVSAELYTEIADGHTAALTEYADKVSELVEVISPFM